MSAADRRHELIELARVFLKLGVVSFGGPMAHVALMRHECVTRRGWLTDEAFLDLVGATNLIPGPNSTEMAIHIGRLRAGTLGLIVAGACFILPAFVIVLGLAAAYVRFGTLPETQSLFYGLKPVVVAIVAYAIFPLARTAVRSVWAGVLALAACAGAAWGVHELVLLAVCGVAGALARAGYVRRESTGLNAVIVPFTLQAPSIVPPVAMSAGTLFYVFFKAGALLFGSGYVLLAFLRADLVERLHWLSERQLVDAIAVGQFTPGPVFTTATFVGYLLNGTGGALVATGAIFLPAFVYVAVSAPVIPKLRRSRIAGGVLDGVNIASLALMAVTTARLAGVAIVDPVSGLLGAGALVALAFSIAGPAWLMLVGAVVGLLTSVIVL